MIFAGALLAIQVACIIDVIRNRRPTIWVMALMFLPVASAIAYVIIEVYPRLKRNRHVRTAREVIVDKLDPERELRSARDALGLANTAANRMRLADALVARGLYGEALPLYRDAVGKSRPDYRVGEKLARCLFLMDRSKDALEVLDTMAPPSTPSDRDRVAVLRARVLDDLGEEREAEGIYADVVSRYAGDEVRCRYAGLLLRQGRKAEARRLLDEVEARLRRMTRQQRAADAEMYDWAMAKLAELRR